MKKLKLITALGNKDLILELIDFFNGGDRYRYSSEALAIRARFNGGWHLTELHLICTKDTKVIGSLAALQTQLGDEYPALSVYPIRLPCTDITCADDDDTMRDMIYDEVKKLAADDLVISSGGRKTMTNRLIEAGLLFGCMGYLSITDPQDHHQTEESKQYNALWIPARDFVSERRLGLIKDDDSLGELGDNFRSLYLLPTAMIKRLRKETIGMSPLTADSDLAWLQKLPKADLHCHLGGAYDAALLKEMAASLLVDLKIDQPTRDSIRSHFAEKIGKPLAEITAHDLKNLRREKEGKTIVHCLQNLECLFNGLDQAKHVCTAVLVDALTQPQIEELSRDGRANGSWPTDLDWYMACGDLGGSSLLQTERNLRQALAWLMHESQQENVCYLEVRFSPDNYTRAGLTIRQVIDTLLNEAKVFMDAHAGFQVNFLIMATRHKDRAAMIAHVSAAVTFSQATKDKGPRLVGFDLAGQEEGNDPAQFQDIFMPLHYHFINITIHAGEMAEDDKIWQALYLLHAKRIGHGLKLINNAKMMNYVRDYGIAIEMCPSSNRQTNSFSCFDAETAKDKDYPLHEYLQEGLAVTINTDNRGISATTLANEYLQAARLTKGGLSRWEILRLVKNGIKAVFLPKDQKDRLLKDVDEEIFRLILEDLFPGEAH